MFKKLKSFTLHRSFIFKFLTVICILSIVIVPISLSVSAATASAYNIIFEKPLVSDTAGYVELLLESTSDGHRMVYVYYFQLILHSSNYTVQNPYVVFNFSNVGNTSFIVSSDTEGEEYSNAIVYGGFNSESHWQGTYNYSSSLDSFNVYLNLPSGYEILGARRYGFVRFQNNKDFSGTNNDFTVLYGSDAVINNSINSLIAAWNNNSQNITNNADKNAADIQQNQDENTDKIINGTGEDYTVDTGDSVDRFETAEADVLGNVDTNILDEFLSDISMFDTAANGTLAVSNIFGQFFDGNGLKVSPIKIIIRISLYIGALIFALGVAPRLFKSVRGDSS